MLATVEVRWFLPGVVPTAAWHWFDVPESRATVQPSRVDYYLPVSNSESLGIKLREDRIEVKQRHGQQAAVHFAQGAGHVEQWRKWSFPLAEASSMMAELGDGLSSWIGIHKERRVRVFQMSDDTVVGVSGNILLEQGCAWEVTQVRVEKTAVQWWSVGFEAFGGEAERETVLRRVAGHFLAMAEAPVFMLKDSSSYPKWLRNLG